jgi:hypothetical protein
VSFRAENARGKRHARGERLSQIVFPIGFGLCVFAFFIEVFPVPPGVVTVALIGAGVVLMFVSARAATPG